MVHSSSKLAASGLERPTLLNSFPVAEHSKKRAVAVHPAAKDKEAAKDRLMASKGQGKGKGKDKGKGKGKGKGKPSFDKTSLFQIKLEGMWKDYDRKEDMILKRAFLIGHPNVRYSIRGQVYEYSFKSMRQLNLLTTKEREIRPPKGMRPPQQPLLPAGSVVMVTVPPGTSGGSITIDDPQNKGQKIRVNVPQKARPGQKMAVPVPDKGQTVEEVAAKQKSWSTGAKLAAVGGAVGAAAVGGVLLGDHHAGGHMAGDLVAAVADHADAVGDWAAEAADDVGDWMADAADDIGDWVAPAADHAGDWVAGAADDIGDWAADAADDVGEWGRDAADDIEEWFARDDEELIPDAIDDAGEWLGDAADDIEDFIMSLF